MEPNTAEGPPGIHVFHIHEVGTCDPATGFESAGGHLGSGPHGFMVEEGPHAGDLANQTARDDGTMLVEVFNERVDGEMSLFDDDGAALVVHVTADDYRSQPSGTGGDPLACGVIDRG